MNRYQIELSLMEAEEMKGIIRRGVHSTQVYRAAYVLLNCDQGPYGKKQSHAVIAAVLRVGHATIERVVRKFVEGGWEAVLERKPSVRTYARKIDGEVEAQLVRLCCSEPPEGRVRWTLRMLADKLVELRYVDSISHVAVGEVLKKTNLSPGR